MLIQTNFIAGKMNKSVDERLVPVGEYVDALNVRLGSTEGTEIGAVENSKGNSVLTDIQYQGADLSEEARCIGAFEDGMRETIYWFVSDPGNVDMILSFNTETNSLTYHVVSETVLNFSQTYLITGVNKISNLLFFTDNLNPPRYINVDRNYPPPSGGVDGIEEEDVSVIVKPPGYEDVIVDPATGLTTYEPLASPHLVLSNNNTTEDYMENRFLSFAYRYRYLDGGYSAISLFTNPAFVPKNFDFSVDTFKNEGMTNRYNSVDVYYSSGSKRVQEIQLLYKETSSNNIYIITRLNKTELGMSDNSFYSESFSNSKILSVLGSDELLRLYDNVPRLAQAQTIQGNRLMYGNFKDQYNVTSVEGGSNIQMQYQLRPLSNTTGGLLLPLGVGSPGTYNIDPVNPGYVVNDSVITFDLNSIATPIAAGTTFSFALACQNVATANNSGADINPASIADFVVNLSFVAPVSFPSVDSMLASEHFAASVGTPASIAPIIPYANPDPTSTPPGNYPPISPFPPQAGFTATDRFNSAVPYAWKQVGKNTLMLLDSSIDGQCTGPFPLTTFPPISDICGSQDPIRLLHPGTISSPTATGTFSLQLTALLYYFTPDSITQTKQYEYFAFNLGTSKGSYSLLDSTRSLHSHRDYEVGVVYLDEYGRASTVLESQNNTTYFPPYTSIQQNKIQVSLQNLAPYWAKHYKFVVKPSQGRYETIWSALSFAQTGCLTAEECGPTPFNAETGSYWFRLEGDSQNIVSVGDVLTVKRDATGPVTPFVTAEVLDKESIYSKQINGTNPAGIYMRLKASGWSPLDSTLPAGGNINCSDTAVTENVPFVIAKCVFPANTEVPLGSSIGISFEVTRAELSALGIVASENVSVSWDGSDRTVGANYDNIHDALVGESYSSLVHLGSATDVDNINEISFDPILYSATGSPSFATNSPVLFCRDEGANISVCLLSNVLPYNPQIGSPVGINFNRPSTATLGVTVNFSSGVFCFETEPAEVDPNLFYDASELLDTRLDPVTGLRYHQAKRIWSPDTEQNTIALGGQDQTASGVGLITDLDFYNCYTFGNGVESFRIEDRIDGKYFNLGERVLAVSNSSFKEADRFAGMTYSGVFSDPSNLNNLNEFNLGLVNFKDLETDFGPIMKLHSRETDILVLQEDRISYVLTGKNVITDATGGGAIASVPEVLGTQIARIEEFGISFNPESFVSWGAAMFFTDSKRSAVLMLRGASKNSDQLSEISSFGMRSWFRDEFTSGVKTQKLGGYDPYMDEFVLGVNNIQVPTPVDIVPCGQAVSKLRTEDTLTYLSDLGSVSGQVNVSYFIAEGSITIKVTWGGNVVINSAGLTGGGTLSFAKSASAPDVATIEISVDGSPATYHLSTACPSEIPLTVVRMVVNTSNYNGQSIHVEHEWNDTVSNSPVQQNGVKLSTTSATSFYSSQQGVRSAGMFPYNGSSVTMRTRKVSPDTFNFDPSIHKLRILSSNTLYNNTAADVSTLLGLAPAINPIINPSVPVYQASTVGTLSGGTFVIPEANNFLYLVWDLRDINTSELCYSSVSAQEACCSCSLPCLSAWFSPMQGSVSAVCAVDTNSFGSSKYSYNGSGTTPQIGETVFSDNTLSCSAKVGGGLGSGFYIVDQSQPSAASPKTWVQIGVGGLVINSGTC